jgi:hypothetical protein
LQNIFRANKTGGQLEIIIRETCRKIEERYTEFDENRERNRESFGRKRREDWWGETIVEDVEIERT